jgi:Tfp pilus assembly PilM family ATPase
MFDLFKKIEKRCIGIDLGESSIKLVDITNNNNNLILNNYTEVELGPYVGKENGDIVKLGDKELERAIKDLYEASKSNCKNFVMSVPMHACLLKTVTLPIETKSILDQIVPYELGKDGYIDTSELKITFNTVSETESIITVLVLAVKQKEVNRINNIFANIDHDILHIEPSIFGLSRNIKIENVNDVNMIIDFGASITSVLFVSNTKVYMSQTFSKGVNQIILNIKNSLSVSFEMAKKIFFELDILNKSRIESEICSRSFGHILEEVIHIQNDFYNKFSLKCSNIYISGGGSKIINVEKEIQEYFPTAKVSNIYGFDRLYVPEALKNMTHKNSGTFNNAIGLALSELE